jgi:hypothetical protein
LIWVRLIVLTALALFSSPAAAEDPDLTASRGELYLRLADGRVVSGEAVQGATLLIRQDEVATAIRIDRVEVGTAGARRVLLYELSTEGSSPSERRSLCRADVLGRQAAIPVATSNGGIRFTCTSGAEGKCALLGYVPWDEAGPYPMPLLHQACVHLMRADYGGDGTPATVDGTLIHVFDRFGIRPAQKGTGMLFEAAWSPEGAVCVARVRNPRLTDLKTLVNRYPRLAGRVGPRYCREAAMRQRRDAILFNLSRPIGGS